MLIYRAGILDWQAIDTVIHFIEVLIIITPAIVFLYYRIQSVKVTLIEVKEAYATLLIHNRKNKSIFVKNIIVLADNDSADPVVEWENRIKQLKPDESLSLKIHFDCNAKCHIVAKIVYFYNREMTKKVEIK